MSLPTRVIGGHKAAVNNPNVSDDAKEHSRQVIGELDEAPETQETRQSYQEDPNVSEEAKEHARDVLEDKHAF